MGKSTLGLAYGLNVAEAVLAPAMPSTSARAGMLQAVGGDIAGWPCAAQCPTFAMLEMVFQQRQGACRPV